MKRTRRGRPQHRRRRPTWILPAITLAAVVATAGLIWLNSRSSSLAGETVTVPTGAAYPYADGTALGPPNAPVLVEEYSDFQ